MKNLAWLLGFVLGVFVAVGCDAEPEDAQVQGVLFECGDDMCLSTEEICLRMPMCTADFPETFACRDLEEMEYTNSCTGDESTGIECYGWCG